MATASRTVSYGIPYSFVPNHTTVIEALARSKLSGREMRILLFIMRQTDGYLRNEDAIKPEFFASKTGIGKDHVPHVLSGLHHKNIIAITPGRPPSYSVRPPGEWSRAVFAENGEPDSPKMARKLAKNGEKHSRPKDNLKTTRINGSIDHQKYIRGRYGHRVHR